jgi:uncharacterized damage-inducible protein DinB
MDDDLRYPVGRFDATEEVTPERRRVCIEQVAEAPARLREAVAGLDDAQLDTPYREGGWTVRQVLHHLADSHINAYVRMKLALTEDSPAIKTYDEARWAELADSRDTPPEVSLTLLDALHRRWLILLRSLGDADWAKTFRHPEWGEIPLEKTLALYAWHGRHHVAHVTRLRERMGW